MLLTGLAVHAANGAFGLAAGDAAGIVERHLQVALVLSGAVLCLFAGLARPGPGGRPWRLLAAGIGAWAVGLAYFDFALRGVANPPYPSGADVAYLTFYPFAYRALFLLGQRPPAAVRATLVADGAIAALAVAAVAAGVVYQPVVDSTGASAAVVLTNLAYPFADIVLLAMVVCVYSLHGWRPGRSWGALTAGLLALVLGDAVWLWQVAGGDYVHGGLLDTTWPAAMLLLGVAAWIPERPAAPRRPEAWGVLHAPLLFALVALTVLTYGQVESIGWPAAVLALAALLAVIGRAALALREARSLAGSHLLARTDELTGLPNRRAFTIDLRAACAGGQRWALALFDLDGFKTYNDTYGHPAGDALLSRLGYRLGASCSGGARAYRLGGDEFCVLAPLAPGAGTEAIVEPALIALADSGRNFAVSASHGVSLIPEEAAIPPRALRIADQRMYSLKHSRDRLALDETRELLLRVLDEQQPHLHDHSDGVAELARKVGTRMGLDPRQLEHVRQAAALHDIGKVAIPTSILCKPGPLDDGEWQLMRTHTLIGERILAAVPRLAAVGRIIRSSHERWDGAGYPDGLGGGEIPLESRIIAACDAWDAMVEDRVYRPAMPRASALDELRRNSGTQFDPAVTAALLAVLEG